MTFNTIGSSIYTSHKNKVIAQIVRHGRIRFNKEVLLFTRKQGIKPIIRSLKRNIMFYMLPDMNFVQHDAVFTSFFGHHASTLTTPTCIAAATHATVIPIYT